MEEEWFAVIVVIALAWWIFNPDNAKKGEH